MISTHALTWSATLYTVLTHLSSKFQLTHSRGVRLNRILFADWIARFQLTHSRGVRLFHTACYSTCVYFNSRTHVECDLFVPIVQFDMQYFNSRTHVECDDFYFHRFHKPYHISTHALTWSATLIHSQHLLLAYFNSRTHVECDIVLSCSRLSECNFNSRTHVECDWLQSSF